MLPDSKTGVVRRREQDGQHSRREPDGQHSFVRSRADGRSASDATLRIEETELEHVLIIHEVESYPAWKIVFDNAAGLRRDAGEISYQLLRYDNDENRVVHFSRWSSLERARRFFESPELQEIRRKAGVKAPEFIYLQQIERGIL